MLTLKTVRTYGDTDVTQVVACDGDNMLIIGTIYRVEYPSYMNACTVWIFDLYIKSDIPTVPYQTFEETLDAINNHMDDISKVFYTR